MREHIRRKVRGSEFGGSTVRLDLKTSGLKIAVLCISFALLFFFQGFFWLISFKVISAGLLFIGLGVFLFGLTLRIQFFEWIEFHRNQQVFKYYVVRLGSRIINETEKHYSESFENIRVYWNAEEQRTTNTVRIVTPQHVLWITCSKDQHNSLMDWYSKNFIKPEKTEQEILVAPSVIQQIEEPFIYTSKVKESTAWLRFIIDLVIKTWKHLG